MEILHKCKKSVPMSTMDKLQIYNVFKNDSNNSLNEKLRYNSKILFSSYKQTKKWQPNNKMRFFTQRQAEIEYGLVELCFLAN